MKYFRDRFVLTMFSHQRYDGFLCNFGLDAANNTLTSTSRTPTRDTHAHTRNRIDVVSALILRGDDINDWSSFPLLALHAVAEKDHVDLARFLIAKGAEIDNMGQTDQTPLQVASRSYSHGVARLLIENGAATTGIDLSWMENQ
jgi:ankyrin repeat protein